MTQTNTHQNGRALEPTEADGETNTPREVSLDVGCVKLTPRRYRVSVRDGGTGELVCALTASKTRPSHGFRFCGPQTAMAARPPRRSTR